jgi:osmoprotectant transport system ATP-binding protein
MISFEHVGKAYEGRRALHDATFRVEGGEFCIFVGPSGAGKSTALRLVNRMIAPDAGVIRIDGVDIATMEPVALRRRLGYVIQSIGLFPHWSVARNIATVPSLLGWPKARIRARVDELLFLVDLDPATYRDRAPNQLSGGQQQRVGLARALAADPQILLMDEPFGALDAVTRDTLQSEMIRIRAATGKTILMVTHDIDEAIRLATRIVVFENGQVVQNARPAELLSAPANNFVRALVGGEAAGLRLLRIRRVQEIVDPNARADGEPISADAMLDAALARMLVSRRDTLPVVGKRGEPLGVIRLADLARKPT